MIRAFSRRLVALSSAILLLVACSYARAHTTAPAVKTERIRVRQMAAAMWSGEVNIDGKVDEPCWQSATEAGHFTLERDTSLEARYSTTVRALHDERQLYFAFTCEEPEVAKLITRAASRDDNVWQDDCVEIYVDPAGSGKSHYHFVVNAAGVQGDAKHSVSLEPAVFHTVAGPVTLTDASRTSDDEWDASWKCATTTSQDAWCGEVAIPLASLGLTSPPKSLRVNFARNRLAFGRRLPRTRRGEYSVWADPKCNIHTPDRFGLLKLLGRDEPTPATTAEVDAVALGLPGLPGKVPVAPAPAKVRLRIHADQAGEPLKRFWDGLDVALTHPPFTERTFAKGYSTHARTGLALSRAISFANGKLETDFERVDRQLDAIKDLKIRTVVCLRGWAQGIEYRATTNNRYGRVVGAPADPEDYKRIYTGYRAFFQHVRDLYGKDFLDSLRFEFMNEPNASQRFFSGTVEDYCQWYDWVAKALKDVSPSGKIGGPAVSGDGQDFTRSFLTHCREGTNAATGKTGSPLDFITFHVYGWRSQLCPAGSAQAINTLVSFWKLIHEEGFSGREVYLTEWGVEHSGSSTGPYYWFRNTHYAPVWMAKFVKDIDDARTNYAHLHARMDGMAICLAGMTSHRSPFVGRRTIFVGQYVPKPYFNGYVLLNELGTRRLKVSGDGAGRIECLATRRDDGALAILVFHFAEYVKSSPPEEDVLVELAGLPLAGKAVSQMRIDHKTSNSHTEWVGLGSPGRIDNNTAELLTAAARVQKTPLRAKNDAVAVNMPANSVAIVLVVEE